MGIEVLPKYTRRGKVCMFTFRLEFRDTPLRDVDGQPYEESFHFAYMRWDGEQWHVQKRWSHATYPPPREPTEADLQLALATSDVPVRAIAAMRLTPAVKDGGAQHKPPAQTANPLVTEAAPIDGDGMEGIVERWNLDVPYWLL